MQGLLDGIVEDAVAAGEMTVEEAAELEDAIEEAAVEITQAGGGVGQRGGGRACRRMTAAPERTCAGCGRKAPQSELVRFGAVGGRLTPGRTLPGRGVYTCSRLACFERARASRGFNRVLRQTVVVDPELSRIYTAS